MNRLPGPARGQQASWEKFDRLVPPILDPYVARGAIEDYELFNSTYIGSGLYALKIGVYPWGATILEGRMTDILNAVREIAHECVEMSDAVGVMGASSNKASPVKGAKDTP